jgi:adenosylcobinamide-GDP ribazoletransferase
LSGLWLEARLAFGFLTRIPVGIRGTVDTVHVGRSMAFFPLTGLLLGGVLLGADAVLAQLLPRPVGDALLLVLLVLLTGALHLDGFADLCDGLGGGRDRDAALRIMKDSRIGAFGSVGLLLLVLVKYQALTALPETIKAATLLLMPVLGRWAPVLLTVTSPYLRGPEGTGAAFAAHAGRRELLLATLTLLAVATALFRGNGLLLVGGGVVVTLGFGFWIRQRLGGVTGDVLGAAVELLEVVTLLLVLAFIAP